MTSQSEVKAQRKYNQTRLQNKYDSNQQKHKKEKKE